MQAFINTNKPFRFYFILLLLLNFLPLHAATLVQQLNASDPGTNDLFGDSVSISGNRAVIGGFRTNNDNGSVGAAYVFEYNGSSWVETQKLIPVNANETFVGVTSVSISGNRIVLGTPELSDTLFRSGAIYIFDYNGTSWVQTHEIFAANKTSSAYFGSIVSLDGDRILVAATNDNTAVTYVIGDVYVLDYNGSTWIETKLQVSDLSAGDKFGISLDLEGNRAIIGAYWQDDATEGVNTGAAYIFDFNGSAWIETQKLKAADLGANYNFGHSVSLSGDTVLIGAKQDGENGFNSGAAYIFDYNSSQQLWSQSQKLVSTDISNADGFGSSVSLSGNRAIIGAVNAPSVYGFYKTGSSWSQVSQINTLRSDLVSLDNALGIIGNSFYDNNTVIPTINNAGTAYIYDFDTKPSAIDDNASIDEDNSGLILSVLSNDTDPDGGAKAITAVSQPSNGTTAIVSGNTQVQYIPDANYCNDGTPTDNFTYTLNGGSTATVSITVACIDDAPVAVTDILSINEDIFGVNISVLANDTDIDGGPMLITSITSPPVGVAYVFLNDTNIRYEAPSDYCTTGSNPVEFTYTLNGGSTTTVSITVNCIDDAPVAVDDTATIPEDTPFVLVQIYNNDTDIDGGLKEITSFTQPSIGSVSQVTNALKYRPPSNYCNDGSPTDDFTYTLNGGSTATVRITVTCVDDAPVAIADTFIISEDQAPGLNVLNNDTDIDAGPLNVISVSQATFGSVTINANTVFYTPDLNYCTASNTTDDFTYTLNGGSIATVKMTVNCVDDAPIAVNDVINLTEDDSANTVMVLTNDTDVDGGTLSVMSISQPSNGTATFTANTVIYTPNANYCNETASDTFTYTLNGGSTATVSANVSCVDDLPVAVSDAITLDEDTPTVLDVLSNDTDIDGGTITIESISQPSNGTVINNSSSLSYAPDLNYCNEGTISDDFNYTLNGGTSATVSITITCLDDLPVAVNDSFTILEDSPVQTFTLLDNDTDVDGGPQMVESITQAANGTLVNNGSSVDYQPNANYCNDGTASDSFEYTLNGGSTAIVSILVSCINDAPSFTLIGDVSSDSSANTNITIANFIDSFVLGPDNEASQQILQFNVSEASDSSNIVDPGLTISNTGTLSLNFSGNTGVAVIEVSMQDTGGTALGGVDTSSLVQFNVSFTDVIYSDGFEEACCLRVIQFVEKIASKNLQQDYPRYDFNSNSIVFLGGHYELSDDYNSLKLEQLVKSWLKEILIVKQPFLDFDEDGIINRLDSDPLLGKD